MEGLLDRSSGILLHPTSLPGRFGIGDLGPAAYDFVGALARARVRWWQVLPLGPTGAGDSPYQSFSAFAGNTLLLSPEALARGGLVNTPDLDRTALPPGPVDYGSVLQRKRELLERAWSNFRDGAGAAEMRVAFEKFRQEQRGWLEDFALFLAIKQTQGGGSWQDWPQDLRLRDAAVLSAARRELQESIQVHAFGQFLFFRQWNALRAFARGKGVRFLGDLPIFVAFDSADVWTHPELFQLDAQARPRVVAGVPPDYFSATGQLWGNPHYDWPALRRTDYAWWINRVKATLAQVDLIRLDHFRGFVASWEVPAGSLTAETGRWAPGPAAEFFETLRKHLPAGPLPFIAEDLGVITPEVEGLRQQFGLPGMRILQFTFGDFAEERFLPHNFRRPTVVYTGTHDNDTTLGWYAQLDDTSRRDLRRYFPATQSNIAWDLIHAAWASVADIALTPLQDVLSLGTEARMNYPGKAEGNWRWRMREEDLTPRLLDQLADWNDVYRRSQDGNPVRGQMPALGEFNIG
jgi:4-alpha-glucanotransferase